MIATHETYTLNVPVSHQGRDYTELQVRRPTARDILRSAKQQNLLPLEIDMRQLVDLCEVPREVIDALDLSDLIGLQVILKSFANPSEAEIRKAIMLLSVSVGWDLATLEERPVDDIIEWLKTLKEITPRKPR